ncbi:TPA: HNH endonuclease [Stenotrophomonas maltophilia]
MKRRGNGQIERAVNVDPKEYAASVDARIAAKLIRDSAGCLIWQGAKTVNGYGQVRLRSPANHSVLVHRWVYQRAHGGIPAGVDICHHCDNRACAELSHLFVGTRQENMDDMVAKGRSPCTQGELSGKAVLKESDVQEMDSMRSFGATHAQIAKKFGVHSSHVSRILSGKRWGHMKAGSA